MSALLEVENLSKRFGGLRAVQELSFQVPEGAILGLIGPNGAGKSTVFNLINGVFPPSGGKIIFRGQNLTGLPAGAASIRNVPRYTVFAFFSP